MKLEGRIWKDEETNYWVVYVPLLDISTQGRTRKAALAMIKDAIQVEAEQGLNIQADLSREQGVFTVSADDPDSLIAFLLRRQRTTSHGLSVRAVARRLKSNSPTAYAQYEQGKRSPSLGKLRDLLHAIDPKLDAVLKVG